MRGSFEASLSDLINSLSFDICLYFCLFECIHNYVEVFMRVVCIYVSLPVLWMDSYVYNVIFF